jgi:hypothetical protein
MKTKYSIQYSLLLILTVYCFTGCKKFINVEAPSNTVNIENVYTSDASAIAAVSSVYINMSIDDKDNFIAFKNGLPQTSLYPCMSSDELTLFDGATNEELIGCYQNNLKASQISATNFWKRIYSHLFNINSAIDGIEKSTTLTPSIKEQLLGESYFMRAFCYFYLVNIYGDVPLITGLDYTTTSLQPRTSKTEVYALIKMDLLKAQGLLVDDYLDATLVNVTEERVRPNKTAATALLARVYLFTEDYELAEVEATKVINNSGLYSIVPLQEVFLMNSMETIWALQAVGNFSSSNTGEGKLFVLKSTGPTTKYQVYLNERLRKSFEIGDQRLNDWISKVNVSGTDYYFPFKYKIGEINTTTAEYPVVLRLAEQFLIRAEAKIQQGKISDGITDLNVLRTRATDFNAPADQQLKQLPTDLSKKEALNAVLHERQVELFTEWGHRWFDLKRTGTINTIMPAVTQAKGGTWNNNAALYPIPLSEIQNNPNLVQNPGYQ